MTLTPQPCWRVAVLYHRRDATGRFVVVERHGPIIVAADSVEARQKAETICRSSLDYAGLGEATYLHVGHRGLVPTLPTERRPAQSPDLTLEESLLRMAAAIRARRHR